MRLRESVMNLRTLLALAAGSSLSILVFQEVRASERRSWESEFHSQAQSIGFSVQRNLNNALGRVQASAALFQALPEVSRAQFSAFAKPLLEGCPSIQALEWIPRVPHGERERYEQAARDEGHPGFQFTERVEQGHMVRRRDREEYYPVYYTEPCQDNELALGFDISSDPKRLAVLELSKGSGQALASEPITLVQELTQRQAFLLLWPVLEAPGRDAGLSAGSLKGFALGVYRIGDLLSRALHEEAAEDLWIQVSDVSDPLHEIPLHAHPQEALDLEPSALPAALHETRLDVAGRDWSLRMRPGPEFYSAQVGYGGWTLGTGLFVTLLVATCLQRDLKKRISVQRINESLEQRDRERQLEITSRQQAEAKLSQTASLLTNVLESTPDLVFVKDRELRLLLCNHVYADALGKSPQELRGKTDLENGWGAEFVQGNPEKNLRGFERDDRMALSGEAVRNPHDPALIRGELRIFDTHKIPLRDENNRIFGLLGISRDITERGKSEAKLRDSEERYRYFVERTAEGVYRLESAEPIDIHSSEGAQISAMYEHMLVAECNDMFAAMHGFQKASEMIGMRFVDLHGGSDTPENRKALLAFIRDNYRVIDVETQEVGEDKEPVYFLNNAVGILREERLLGMWGTQRDITERKREERERREFEAQVQHAQKLESLGVLAGGIAHDFNNILTGILGNAGLAEMELQADSPAAAFVHQIEQSALRAADLCKQMLAYSGKSQFVVTSVNLSTLVKEVMSMIQASISKKVVLNCHLAADLPAVIADPSQVQQVIMNLITNASDATALKGGVITITTKAKVYDHAYLKEASLGKDLKGGLYVCLEIADTGSGMDNETREKLFDPFFTTKFTGRGLGLAAVLGIVRGHKGAIKVLSEPDKGTVFQVLFPASKSRIEAAPQELDLDRQWRGQGMVLVVDDEATIRELAKLSLSRFGFEVLTAENGREAIELYRQHFREVVAVLLDLTLPVMSGEEVYHELRRIRSDVRVLLSSGYDEQDVVAHFVEKNLAGFVQKPYRPKELVQKVREVLEHLPQ